MEVLSANGESFVHFSGDLVALSNQFSSVVLGLEVCE